MQRCLPIRILRVGVCPRLQKARQAALPVCVCRRVQRRTALVVRSAYARLDSHVAARRRVFSGHVSTCTKTALLSPFGGNARERSLSAQSGPRVGSKAVLRKSDVQSSLLDITPRTLASMRVSRQSRCPANEAQNTDVRPWSSFRLVAAPSAHSRATSEECPRRQAKWSAVSPCSSPTSTVASPCTTAGARPSSSPRISSCDDKPQRAHQPKAHRSREPQEARPLIRRVRTCPA